MKKNRRNFVKKGVYRGHRGINVLKRVITLREEKLWLNKYFHFTIFCF